MKVKAHQILKQISKRHDGEPFFTEVKSGRTFGNDNLLILDAIGFKKSWANQCITGYEIKVDRNDFVRDEKWVGYKAYCNKFYFACPSGLIDKNEISPDVGLIYYNPEKDSIYTRKQALFRDIDVPKDMLLYLITARYCNVNPYPFFNSRVEFFQEWLENKRRNKELGWNVKNHMAEEITRLNGEITEMPLLIEQNEKHKQQLNKIREILKNAGICKSLWRGEWIFEFEEWINSKQTKLSPEVLAGITELERGIARLKDYMKVGKPDA